MSFSQYDVVRRTSKNIFYTQINQLIDWQAIEKEIRKHYQAGSSATGCPAYSGLLLFKMLLLSYWNGGLSDRSVEEMANENLSAMRFLGLTLEDLVPDHSVLCRFRKQLVDASAFEDLLTEVNKQINAHGLLVKTGIKVDASITDTLRKPKGKTTYEIAQDRKEDEVDAGKQAEEIRLIKKVQPGVDQEARWTKKAGKLHYGYKKHVTTDDQGLVLSVSTTSANVHDSLAFEEIIEKAAIPKHSRILADKAYKSKSHDEFLKQKGFKNGIHLKAVRGKPLTQREKQFNKAISKRRYTVERTFGSQVRWFRAGVARYVGMSKTHAQHLMEAMAYNIKRLPNLYILNEQKLLAMR